MGILTLVSVVIKTVNLETFVSVVGSCFCVHNLCVGITSVLVLKIYCLDFVCFVLFLFFNVFYYEILTMLRNLGTF